MTNSKTIIAGMDEAGRGPAIGPIVFGVVGITPEQEKQLIDEGIKDSKTLNASLREKYNKKIKEIVTFHDTLTLSAKQIDELMAKGINLNKIEVISFKQLLEPYASKISILQLDAADVNAERFGLHFQSMIQGNVLSRHKGDSIFISVGAASILAKVERDYIIKQLQAQMLEQNPELPTFGSGYPQDAKPFLKAYVKKYQKLPNIARHKWKTCSKIIDELTASKQTTLDW